MTLLLHQANMVGCSAISHSWINLISLVILSFAMFTITIESLSTARNYNTEQWSKARKAVVKKAIATGRVQYVVGDDSGLSDTVRPYYYQLIDNRLVCDINTRNLLPWAVCKTDTSHVMKANYKIRI